MAWTVRAELVFPPFMASNSYDACGTVWDWFDRDSDAGDAIGAEFDTQAEAEAAVRRLKKEYLGKDIHGVSCRLTIVEI